MFALAAKSSKLAGARWLRNLYWIKARFNCCKTDAPPLSAITAAGAGWVSAAGFMVAGSGAAGLGADGDEVFSWVAVCCGAAVVVDEGMALALSCLPQPAASRMAPKTSVGHKPLGFIDRGWANREESESVFILIRWRKWY